MRLRRYLLKSMGRWPRRNYDVRLIHQHGRLSHKQIIFKTVGEARRVSESLQQYGATPHLPTWRGRQDNAVWVDFIDGTLCHHIDDALLPQLAECFGRFASRGSHLARLDSTSYWGAHFANLDYLRQHRVICPGIHRDLGAHSNDVAPTHVRIGFDYTDPIGANLVQRQECGRICAIDIKNIQANTLVGQGLAKASDRWLNDERRRYLFAHLETLGLHDIQHSFSFLLLFETVHRIRCKAAREIAFCRRVKAPRAKRDKLAVLLP